MEGYRYLTNDDTIRDEDQYLGTDNKWHNVINFIGYKYDENFYMRHRRDTTNKIIWPHIHNNMTSSEVESKRVSIPVRIKTFRLALINAVLNEDYKEAAYRRDKICFFKDQLEFLNKLYPLT